MKDFLPSSSYSEPPTFKSILRKRVLEDAFTDYECRPWEMKKPLIEPPASAVKADPATVPDNVSEDTLLAEDFQPGNWHVIYGREKIHKEHVGNKRLRVLIANNLKAYVEAPSRREKSQIIDDVATQIRLYGGFVKKTKEGRWLSIGSTQAREKVGHSFRDCMKLFKGEKPSDKQAMWEEAQNAIFNNLQLCGRSSTSSASLCSSTPEPVASQSAGLPPVTTSGVCEHDPLPLDDDSCGFASLVTDSEDSQQLLEWLVF